MKDSSAVRKNRRAIIIIAAALLLACLLTLLPAYRFNACVYTKKSSNTFVGDEKYVAARAEVEAIADEYRAQGLDVFIDESVTERTNSKGELTSLVAFKLNSSFTVKGLDIVLSSLPSGYVARAIPLLLLLSLACALAGTRGSMDCHYAHLSGKVRFFRKASVLLALAAVLLVPVLMMMNTYTFSRKPTLYTQGLLEEGMEEFYLKMDEFLFNGESGDGIEAALKGLSYKNLGTLWGQIFCALAAVLAGIQLRWGAVKEKIMRGIMILFIIIVCLIVLYPYYVMFVTAFRSEAETNDMYFLHLFPVEWKWENMKAIVGRGVPRYLLNSLLIAGGATLIAMVCGIPAAYAMARRRFKGKKVFLGFVIMSQMFSPVVLMIGIYQLMSRLSLNDSIVGLMLINAAFNQAFAIWLLRGTFVSISPEMEQAAMIDGCSSFQSMLKILLPMAAPGIVTALIFVFINAWNEYTLSTVLISTATNRPITVGITQFSSFNMIEWPYLFAASLLATLPVVILFVCIEKHLTSGLTSGGVKG